MSSTVIFESQGHKNVLLPEFGAADDLAVQANQHLIIDGQEALILDPGGHKVYSKVLSETNSILNGIELKYLFLSHQDPDIVAAVNGWLMTTDAVGLASSLWVRFIPHFGLDKLVADRLKPIADQGQVLTLGGRDLLILPAHFMHSCGNFHIYDPTSKILYTGDLGASIGSDYREVSDFDSHLQYIEGFHKRYIACDQVLRHWAHIDWCDDLQCGVDLMGDLFRAPEVRTAA